MENVMIDDTKLENQSNELDLDFVSLGEATKLTKGVQGGRPEFCGGYEYSNE